MEFGGAKFVDNSLLHLLLVICICAAVSAESETSWTFNIPGVSFISFSPVYSNTQNQHISLSFRTRTANGLIFCHYLKDLDVKELKRINYKLCGELQYGLFVLNYRLMQFQEDGLTVGKALNNDRWHALDIFINITSGELTVAVDEHTKVTFLKSYTRQDITSLLDWSQQASAIYFGGTDPDTLFSDIYPHLIGCMKDIRYENQNGRLVPIPVTMLEGVEEGCTDKCADNPCHHGGLCINDYTEAICDCFSTDYQGKFCSDLGPTTTTLRGYEWLTYSMYEDEVNILTDKIRFSLEFKTSRGSGVLFYAAGGTPYHSHLTASVHAGTVWVSLGFGDEDIDVKTGIGLDNYRWHNLTILHDNHTVYVYLDGREHMRGIKGNTRYLGLGTNIFIGGGENFVITRGLQVTQNFVGCLKNIYINDVSILYQLHEGDSSVTYHGGGSTRPQYTCQEVVNIPISFPTSAAMLMLDSTAEMKQNFNIEFDFKTVRSEAILLYVSLVDTDTSMAYHFGFIEVWIRQGRPFLKFVPSTLYLDRTQNLTIPIVVNNNVWNTMQVSFKHGQVKLKVNGISMTTKDTGRTLEITSQVVVGYGFNKYKDSEGFVGCIRNLKYQGDLLDALDLMESRSVSGLIIDGCNITDYCQDNQLCKHGGICLSEWTGVACDCSETDYTGHTCHFSKYRRTCDDYYQSGVNVTGVMLIDLDGSGPLEPVHVQCNMGYETGYEFFGKTSVEHNFMSNTLVRRPLMRNMKKMISYRELNRDQLVRLTSESGWCEQSIQYDCIHSPIRLGTLTWFRSANGDMVEYIGTDDKAPGFCTCSLTDSCAGDRCNCDNESMTLQHDYGYNNVSKHLPLTEVTIKQDPNPMDPGSANMTLGPLICWGNRNYMPKTAVTFSSDAGFLLSQPWKSGDIKISFRSHHSHSLILYQTGTEENINFFLVAVTSDTTVKFYFRWGLKKLEVDIVSPVPISNGQWHQITIETDQFNIRCMLDMSEKILSIPDGVPRVMAFSGTLYIGGVPDSVQKDEIVTDIPGTVGCMRGLQYNNRAYPLSDLIDSSTQGVFKFCMASCWPNPCQNGAECNEEWGSHTCDCLNKWAHSGNDCEIDINTDSVTFTGDSTSHLHFERSVTSGLLDSTIVFSFRTFQKDTLLLYVHDQFNNFMQVELQDGRKVVATFNNFNVIFDQSKLVTDDLDDGQWNQVIIDNDGGYIKVIVNVDDDKMRNSYRKQLLESYTKTPFLQEQIKIDDRIEETVKPIRTDKPSAPGMHLYVGGVPDTMSTDSTHPNLHGCIRGLKIGSRVFKLQKKAAKTPGVLPLCEEGCKHVPCKHGGICMELWQDMKYTCDCSYSEYAGPTCNTEASGLFGGKSILQYKYDPPQEAEETKTERLELVFKVDKGATRNMILVFIYSDRYFTHDFLIVYLDPNTGVFLNTNQGYNIHGVGKMGKFADGRPHQLLYQRKNKEMILTVRGENHPKYRRKSISLDEEGIGRVTVPDNALDELDTIMIGGILNSQFAEMQDTADYVKFSNFTGCLSEVTFYPKGDQPFALRPLKDLRDGFNSTGFATTFGPDIAGCVTRNDDNIVSTTTTTPVPTMAPTDTPLVTFPPWNPGPAETIYFGPVPTVPHNSTTTVQTIIPTSTTSETAKTYSTRDRGNHDDKIVLIALSLVGFLLIIAILVAVILVRQRRKQKREKEEKKKNEDMMEMKQPLNDIDVVAIEDNRQNQNYLARLDEFSMVSATLGARPVKTDGMTTFKPPPSESSCAYSSVAQDSEEDGITTNEHRFYNRKKQRPASSISEVLEEMERQRNVKDIDPEDLETLGNGPLQSMPVDTTPLSYPREDFRQMNPIQEDFIYNMLPPPEETRFTELSEARVSSDSLAGTENHEDDASNDADNESDSPSPPPPTHHVNEYNGDSGYEAESKPEEDDEENETLMNRSYHGNGSYEGESTPHSPDIHTYNAYSEGTTLPSPESKNSFMSDKTDIVSPTLNLDKVPPEKMSPTTPDSKIVTYGFPAPVIDDGSEFPPHKSSIITNMGDNT